MIRQTLPQSVPNSIHHSLVRIPSILSISVLIVIWAAMAGGLPASAKLNPTSTSFTQTDQPLEPGARIEKEIASGETHYYRVTLAAGQYLRVAVEQQGIEVTTSLLPATGEKPGEKLIEVDSAGTERVSAIAAEAAGYRIAVQARRSAPLGRYVIKLEELRQATPQDQDRITAERAVAEGMQLTRQGRRESLLQAVEKYQSALAL